MIIMKKKILIISHKIPYPIVHGGAIAQFFFLEFLMKDYDVTFCTTVSNPYQTSNAEALKKAIPSLNLVCYTRDSMSNTQSGFDRLNKLAARTKNKLRHLIINKKEEKTIVVKDYEFDPDFEFADHGFVTFLNHLFSGTQFDFIQLEFFETLSLLPLLPAASKKIVVHHEIRSKKNSLINSADVPYKNYMVESMRIIENRYLDLADSVIVFNEKDKEYLRELGDKVQVSSFGIPDELIEKQQESLFFNRFLFIGGENHYPNKEAVTWFLDMIYLPNSQFVNWPIYITGNWSESFRKKYKDVKDIIFTGFLADLTEVYEHAVMLTPVVSGSGIRTKILQSFANKIPVMSTKFASEGLFEYSETIDHIVHFENEGEFLEKFARMKEDMPLLKELAVNGFNYFCKNFNRSDLLAARMEIYKKIS